jgi:hypothetical protein
MYTTNEEGILNNYAIEPSMYYAEYPTVYEQQRYMLQGAAAFLLVTFVTLVALAAS